MRALIQRVKKAKVTINNSEERFIGQGLLTFVSIENEDQESDADWLSKKICNLRIFNDEDGVMNNSLIDINGSAMIISQFTLHAKTKNGNRPSYIHAAKPDIAIPLYEYYKKTFSTILNKPIVSGEFGAHMDVELINDGPVSIWIDTKNKE